MASQNLSHLQREISFAQSKRALVENIISRGNLPYISVAEQLNLLDQLGEFELGRFLIERGGLDGYWTQYVVQHPENNESTPLTKLEEFLLEDAPTCLATQERFRLFKSQIQNRIKEGCRFASIPCGLMGDLLDLDYSQVQEFALTGIDLDPRSIGLAEDYARENNLRKHCHFLEKNAWQLGIVSEFDLIASNGLNIYEPDDDQEVLLYREFYKALKPGGTLVTSFLTPPPIPGLETEWDLENVNQEDALLQKIIFADILRAKWQVFHTEAQMCAMLKEAGFQEVRILHDKARIFPTVIATK